MNKNKGDDKRPPNELERKLHHAALASGGELSAQDVSAIIPDPKQRQDALNFLLGVGLLKPLKNAVGVLSFRVVTKDELAATKGLTGEERMVLSHIKSGGNEGMWSKHLKTKASLHQTVLDRCIKKLEQSKLIKRVQSVQHPTRKLYMLEGVTPSVNLTGGPWYTDGELDTEFIQTLMKACFKYIRDESFPKTRGQQADGALHPISKSPKYPTAQQVRNALKQARLTETVLGVEHVEMLLNVLVLDGEIERLPAFGASLWDSGALGDDDSSDERRSKKRRKHRLASSDEEDNEASSSRKRKKKTRGDDSESDSEGEVSSKKKYKRKRTKDSDDDDSDVASSKASRKKKKKKKLDSGSSDGDSSEDNSSSKRKAKKKKRSRKARDLSSDESSDSDSDDERVRKSRSRKRSSSPQFSFFDGFEEAGGSVYRAIREERLSFGWSQSPCSICPSFDFCRDGGPVNPGECVYYGDWLAGSTVAAIEDTV